MSSAWAIVISLSKFSAPDTAQIPQKEAIITVMTKHNVFFKIFLIYLTPS
jgi:hypothetical protein